MYKQPRTYMNASATFFSRISSEGTILPRMLRRTPTATINRLKPVLFEPPFAHTNLHDDADLAAALYAQLRRTEFRTYTELFSYTCGISTNDLTRFRFVPLSSFPALDNGAYGPDIVSVEDVLINSALVQPFDGLHDCEYCNEDIPVKDISCLIKHLVDSHQAILSTNFSCPTCLKPTTVTMDTFEDHWLTHHAPTIALISALTESHLGQRIQMGLALQSMITTMKCFKIAPAPADQEHMSMTILGVSGPVSSPFLRDQLSNYQKSELPGNYYKAHKAQQNKKKIEATAAAAQEAAAAAAAAAHPAQNKISHHYSTLREEYEEKTMAYHNQQPSTAKDGAEGYSPTRPSYKKPTPEDSLLHSPASLNHLPAVKQPSRDPRYRKQQARKTDSPKQPASVSTADTATVQASNSNSGLYINPSHQPTANIDNYNMEDPYNTEDSPMLNTPDQALMDEDDTMEPENQ